jgi:peptidoglycan/xylan/chitin deacetylase (PgdA/CDA1 family)
MMVLTVTKCSLCEHAYLLVDDAAEMSDRPLNRAILLTFDNLGEAADLERELPPPAPVGEHPSVTTALPALLDLLRTLQLPATFFVEGINASLYPDAVKAITADGHEVGLHAWRHETWAALDATEQEALLSRSVAAFGKLGIDVDGFRPPGGELGPQTYAGLAAHGVRWCSPLGARVERRDGVAVLPFRWPLVDAYHRMESFADLRRQLGDAPEPRSPREAAEALIAGLEADATAVLILHPFLLVDGEERGEAERVMRRVAELVASGRRWVATGRELAARVT